MVQQKSIITHVTAFLFVLHSLKMVSSNERSKRAIPAIFLEGIKVVKLVSTANFSVNGFLGGAIYNVMLPGTRWCGSGDVATSYNDLGQFRKTDICCRAHDSCPDTLSAGQTKYGIVNSGFYTWSHCDCDLKFYKCLKNNSDYVSDMIGFGYFTILGSKCFKEDYPIVGCKKCKYTTLTFRKRDRKKCAEYILDHNSSKKYQWFDNPFYYD